MNTLPAPRRWSDVTADWMTQALAPRFPGVEVDGVYGPQTRSAMAWPAYSASGVGRVCEAGRFYVS